MSGKNMDVAVVLKLQDQMSRRLAGSLEGAKRQLRGLDAQTLQSQQQLLNRQSAMYGALMKKGVAGTMALAGIQGAAYKAFQGHEKDLAYISTLVDDVNFNLNKLSGNLRSISRYTGKTMHDVARAAYQGISAGIDPHRVAEVLEIGAQTAVAGDVGIETAMTPILAILNAFGYESERSRSIADMLFATVKTGVIEFSQLSNAVSAFSGTAATANFELDETLAALAALTKAGLTPEVAGTALNRLLMFLIDPQDNAVNAAKELGIDFSYEHAQRVGLLAFMQEIQEQAKGSVTALTALFPEQRAFKAAAVLAGEGARNFAEGLEEVRHSAGAMETAFDKMSSTETARWERMKQQIGSVMVDMGRIVAVGLQGPLERLENTLSGFADDPEAIGRLMDWIQGLTKFFGIMVLIGGGGKIVAGIKTLALAAKAGAAGLAFKGGALATGVHSIAALLGKKGLIGAGAAAGKSVLAGGAAAGALKVAAPVAIPLAITKVADMAEGRSTNRMWERFEKMSGVDRGLYRDIYWRGKMGIKEEGDDELLREIIAGKTEGELGERYREALLQPTEELKARALAQWEEERRHNMRMMSLAMNAERQNDRRASKLINDSQWIRDNMGRALGDFHAWMAKMLAANTFKSAEETREARRAALEPLQLFYQDMVMERFTSPTTGLPRGMRAENEYLNDAWEKLLQDMGGERFSGLLTPEEQQRKRDQDMQGYFDQQNLMIESNERASRALDALAMETKRPAKQELVIRNISINIDGAGKAKIGIQTEDGATHERMANVNILRYGGMIAE